MNGCAREDRHLLNTRRLQACHHVGGIGLRATVGATRHDVQDAHAFPSVSSHARNGAATSNTSVIPGLVPGIQRAACFGTQLIECKKQLAIYALPGVRTPLLKGASWWLDPGNKCRDDNRG